MAGALLLITAALSFFVDTDQRLAYDLTDKGHVGIAA